MSQRIETAVEKLRDRSANRLPNPLHLLSPEGREQAEEYIANTAPDQQYIDLMDGINPVFKNFRFGTVAAKLTDDEIQNLYQRNK